VRFSRFLAIVAPAAVFYTLAARAWIGASSASDLWVAVSAVAFSLSPAIILRGPPSQWAGRLAWVGTSLALALACAGATHPSFVLVHAASWAAAAVGLLEAAWPTSTRTGVRLGADASIGAAVVALAILEGPERSPALIGYVALATLALAGAFWAAVVWRRDRKVEAVLAVLATAVMAGALAFAWRDSIDPSFSFLVELLVAVSTWTGALAALDPGRSALRRTGLPLMLATASTFAAGAAVHRFVPEAPWRFGLLATAFGVAWWIVFALAKRLGERVARGGASDLMRRATRAREGLLDATTLEEVVQRSLAPFRSDDFQRAPCLYAFEPPIVCQPGSGGRPHVRSGEPPSKISDFVCADADPDVMDLDVLRQRMIREPELRGLVEAIERVESRAVVPCIHLDQVEGLLMLPSSEQATPLDPRERAALAKLGEALGQALSTALAKRRAESHIQELSAQRRDAEERASTLEGELDRLRSQFDALGRGLAEDQALHVAYSAAMRRVQTRAIELAPMDDPLVLVASIGTPVVPISRFIHDRGPRWEAPFVVGDCAGEAPGRVAESLFGSASHANGWTDAARKGTLLLRDLPALDAEAQARLAARLRSETGDGRPRIITSTHAPIAALLERRALDPALGAALSGRELAIPSLRERREDLPSLVLLAIDRACRLLGRRPLGIDQEAMAALLAHDWPADVAELELVVELAVSRSAGRSIGADDLPQLFEPIGHHADPLMGTYLEIERRLLERALMRAGGNKSEAARMLGLKRTTFLDKLRRHRIAGDRSGGLGDPRSSVRGV